MQESPLTKALLEQVRSTPSSVEFEDAISTIDTEYTYTPTAFTNGSISNVAGTNEGSCKIFAFAKLHSLSEPETLALFGTYYRDDVLANPDGDDHGNIRNFMKTGWAGIQFSDAALRATASPAN